MAVYVDDMNLPADVPNGDTVVSSKWSHLMADTHEELMAAAKALRLNPRWVQYLGTSKEHFDLTSGKRQQAIHREIAQPITWRQAGEMYAAKVQAQQAGEQAAKAEVEANAEELDYRAGVAFRDGDFDKARGILVKAMIEHPEDRQLWNDRLEAVNAKAGKASAPSALPPAGVHREGGGPTTTARFGTFERAPDPPPPHYCPGCTTETERDGKTYVHGPKIEAHQDQCQGCEVEASIQDRDMPAHPQVPADRSDPAKGCARCHTPGVGSGGIICPPCHDEIEARTPAREPAVTTPERDEAEAGQ